MLSAKVVRNVRSTYISRPFDPSKFNVEEISGGCEKGDAFLPCDRGQLSSFLIISFSPFRDLFRLSTFYVLIAADIVNFAV